KILDSLSLNEIDDKEIVPQTVINFVIHSSTDLVLEDATEKGNFLNDPYIMENRIKSILCMPLIHKGNNIAILYLENNSLSNAFTNDRIDILRMLSSQMAVSIENTTMYSHLEDLVEERTQELNVKNEVITKKNEDILDSIRYAERIQRSMLPDSEVINSLIPDSFFLWQPKDIVGGDAYYFELVQKGFYIALIDCTGHGVPGAMMSMVATVFLRRIIIDYIGCRPAEILKQLNMIIKHFLKQDREETLSDDGLDAAVCFVIPGGKKLVYAGARLSLYYNDNGKIVQIKGDRQSIGYKNSDIKFNFTEHEIQIQNDSTFYLTTDGYIDQIGGEKNLPFGWKKFMKLLEDNQNESLEKQCEILKSSIAEYKGKGNPQVDDICVIGFKI
ncbi:MAG: SpoIIE family protein phosphatase, partial [Deltaproteobacteria bacterium]|nr:SpoIIE family protein phosphatase [Deltaproteobacteria bacterium]